MANDPSEVFSATIDAEENLLGALMIESTRGTKEAVSKVSAIIKPWDFTGCTAKDNPERWTWRPRMYHVMLLCDLPPTQINLTAKLAELNLLYKQDCALMSHCIAVVPCSLDYMDYAKAVKDYSAKRQSKYYADKGDIKRLHQITKPDYEDGITL